MADGVHVKRVDEYFLGHGLFLLPVVGPAFWLRPVDGAKPSRPVERQQCAGYAAAGSRRVEKIVFYIDPSH
jgi:hypothetical protein